MEVVFGIVAGIVLVIALTTTLAVVYPSFGRRLEARLPWTRTPDPLDGPLEIVTSVPDEEAEQACQRLTSAGIPAMQQPALADAEGEEAERNVFVPQYELEHAREVLGLDGAETRVVNDGRNGSTRG